jgi:hypothetical protein
LITPDKAMANQHNSSAAAPNPRPVGRFVVVQAFIWILAAPVLGAAVARLAVWVQSFRAPILIFPLLVGCGLGLLLVGLMRMGQIGHRATIWSGTMLAVAVAVAGQHYFSFLNFEDALAAKKPQGLSADAFEAASPDFARFMQHQAAKGRPMIKEYTLRGAAAWASWAIDALLVLFAASTIIHLACRAPYCSVCRSWYRTTRAGPLAADRVWQIAETVSLPIGEPLGTAQYRLSHCVRGCGLNRLELACRGQAKTEVVEAWLSAAQRELVMRVLDGESRLNGTN